MAENRKAEEVVSLDPESLRAELSRFVTFLNALIPDWNDPASVAPAPASPGVVFPHAGVRRRSELRDLPGDRGLAAAISRLADEHRAARTREQQLEEMKPRPEAPLTLHEPQRRSVIAVGESVEVDSAPFNATQKLNRYRAILDREPWLLSRHNQKMQKLLDDAVYAEIFLRSLKRTAQPERQAQGMADRCDAWLANNRYGLRAVTLASILLAAFAIEIPVKHERELQPWSIRLAVA